METPNQSPIFWHPCYRIIPSKIPVIESFERVASEIDLDFLELEAATNTILRSEIGDLTLIPREDRAIGPGSGIVNGPFTHLPTSGSRFTDATYGIYYATLALETAIKETTFHRARFFEQTESPATKIEMTCYVCKLDAFLHDIRKKQHIFSNIYATDPGGYNDAQAWAKKLRENDSNGIVYDSVRHPGGECAAVFKPRVLSSAKKSLQYHYVWDGKKITDVIVLDPFPLKELSLEEFISARPIE